MPFTSSNTNVKKISVVIKNEFTIWKIATHKLYSRHLIEKSSSSQIFKLKAAAYWLSKFN
jgi:hypothetical protein